MSHSVNGASRKVWGTTDELVDTPYYSRHRLHVEAGGYCSLHYHKHRANKFSVVDAEIEVVEFFGPEFRRTRLGPENTYIVSSLVPHYFAVYKPGVVYEEYYSDRGGIVSRDDIIRLVEGSKVAVAALVNLPSVLLYRYLYGCDHEPGSDILSGQDNGTKHVR